MKFTAGLNLTQLGESYPKEEVYSAEDIEDDLAQIKGENDIKEGSFPIATSRGEVIIGLSSNKAAVVTTKNENKLLKNFFIKCEFDSNLLDPWYFCYFLNESREFKEAKTAGLIGATRILTVKEITKLSVALPSIEEQRKIGKVYRQLCRLNYLSRTRAETLNNVVLAIIDKALKGELE